jgi:hypothetical protein
MELQRIFLVALVVALALGLGWVTFMWHPGAGRTPPIGNWLWRKLPAVATSYSTPTEVRWR